MQGYHLNDTSARFASNLQYYNAIAGVSATVIQKTWIPHAVGVKRDVNTNGAKRLTAGVRLDCKKRDDSCKFIDRFSEDL